MDLCIMGFFFCIMFMNWENENKISVFSKLIYRFKALNQNLNYLFFFFFGVGGGG